MRARVEKWQLAELRAMWLFAGTLTERFTAQTFMRSLETNGATDQRFGQRPRRSRRGGPCSQTTRGQGGGAESR